MKIEKRHTSVLSCMKLPTEFQKDPSSLTDSNYLTLTQFLKLQNFTGWLRKVNIETAK